MSEKFHESDTWISFCHTKYEGDFKDKFNTKHLLMVRVGLRGYILKGDVMVFTCLSFLKLSLSMRFYEN